MLRVGTVAAGLLAAVVCFAWPAPGPNVLLITVDGLRPDALSCYGGSAQTPNLDNFAADGVLFERVVTDAPWTTPALASIMTGLDVSRHRLRLPEQVLPAGLETLAQRLERTGWNTAAIVGAYEADHSTGLGRGFRYYEDRYNAPMSYPPERIARVLVTRFDDLDSARNYHRRKLSADSYRTDAAVSDAAIGWLKRHDGRRFLLWVHYFGAQETWDERRSPERGFTALRRQYAETTGRVDSEIGRLVAALEPRGWAANTLVIVVGDHGRSLMEHYYVGHGANLYEQELRVPWLMRFPGRLQAGQRITQLVRTVDVFPTIAALVGLGSPAGITGANALSAAYTTGDIYAESYLAGTAGLSTTVPFEGGDVRVGFIRRAIRSSSWKFIRTEPTPLLDTKAPPPVPDGVRSQYMREELYDLAHDPGEAKNVIAEQTEVAGRLRERLATYSGRGST